MAPVTEFKIWQNSSSSWEGPAEYSKKIVAVPDGPWVVKLTNSPTAMNKFYRAFSTTWFVIGLKSYFIQQDLHTVP